MLTKNEIRALTVELNQAAVVALIRAEAGLPFSGDVAIKRLRELELLEKASWSCTENGRQVVGELVGISYKPELNLYDGLRRPLVNTVSPPASGSPDGSKYKPRADANVAKAIAQRGAICVQCKEEIEKGAPCVWIEGEGMFHPDCTETS
jgi:hypothetical protein